MDYLCTHATTHAKDNENWARFIVNSLIKVKTTKPCCSQSSTNVLASIVFLNVKFTEEGVFKILSLIQVSFCTSATDWTLGCH